MDYGNDDDDGSYYEEEVIVDESESDYDEFTIMTEDALPAGASPFAPRGGKRPDPAQPIAASSTFTPRVLPPASNAYTPQPEESESEYEECTVMTEEVLQGSDSPFAPPRLTGTPIKPIPASDTFTPRIIPSSSSSKEQQNAAPQPRPVHPLFGGVGVKNELAAAAGSLQKRHAQAPAPASPTATARPPHPLFGGGGGAAGGLNDQLKAMALKRNDRVAASGGVADSPPRSPVSPKSSGGSGGQPGSLAEQVAMLAAKRRERMGEDGMDIPKKEKMTSQVPDYKSRLTPVGKPMNSWQAKQKPAELPKEPSVTSTATPPSPNPAPTVTTKKKRIIRKKIIRKADGTTEEIVTVIEPDAQDSTTSTTTTTTSNSNATGSSSASAPAPTHVVQHGPPAAVEQLVLTEAAPAQPLKQAVLPPSPPAQQQQVDGGCACVIL